YHRQGAAVEARGAEAQALEVVDRLNLFPEPAHPLGAGVAAEEGLEVEAGIEFVIEFLAAAPVDPTALLLSSQAERLRAEDQKARGLRSPVGRNGVVELGGTFGNRIENPRGGHQLVRGADLHLEPSAGK